MTIANCDLLLIHPPLVKPSEPPAGIARLAGALNRHGIRYDVIDANIEAIGHVLSVPLPASSMGDTWTRRAVRGRDENLRLIRSIKGFETPDRCRKAVMDINRIISQYGKAHGVRLGLADYQDPRHSPVRSADLLHAAQMPEINPFFPYFSHRLRAHLETRSPSVVGLSLNYLSQALCTFAMIGFLRQLAPKIRIILGGGLATSWMRRPDWKNPFAGLIDTLIAGPGEAALLNDLGIKETNADDDPLPPDYGSFPLDDYLSPSFVLPYSAASGCYWKKCAFCPERAEGNRYQPIPASRVTADLRNLCREKRPSLIHFLDNAISVPHLKALIHEPPPVPWYGFARIGDHLTDPDFCLALKRSGCVMLKLGVESGDQGVLDALSKGIDLQMASLALKTLKKAGIGTYVYLLFGTPPETEEKARLTLEFTARNSEAIDFLNLAIFNLPAYGPDEASLDTASFYDGDLFLYRSFRHPAGWDRHRVRQFLDKEFKRHPSISAILRKDPPFFTSNHAPFFCIQ